jgi:hypothetical protein
MRPELITFSVLRLSIPLIPPRMLPELDISADTVVRGAPMLMPRCPPLIVPLLDTFAWSTMFTPSMPALMIPPMAFVTSPFCRRMPWFTPTIRPELPTAPEPMSTPMPVGLVP